MDIGVNFGVDIGTSSMAQKAQPQHLRRLWEVWFIQCVEFEFEWSGGKLRRLWWTNSGQV